MRAIQGHRPDTMLLITIVCIVIFGLIALSSASAVIGFQQHHDSGFFLKKQMLNMLLGLLVCVGVYRYDYRIWKRFAFPMLILAIGLLLLVFIPGVGRTLLGAKRWIDIGPLFFQPTELVKLMLLIYLARWLGEGTKDISDRAYGLWPFMTIMGIVSFLIYSQPDIGTLGIIWLIALSSYFVGGAPYRDFILISGFALAAFLTVLKTASYRSDRLQVFLNPQFDPQGRGYHISQALLAIGTGGLFGLGLGHSRQKFNYLPEVAGDSIFAVIAEELGLFVVMMLIGLFIVFLIRGYRIARNAPDEFGKILASGITTWICFQAFINIGALSGVIPLTGIPLPLISYGGTSLIVTFAALGLLLNISRYSKL